MKVLCFGVAFCLSIASAQQIDKKVELPDSSGKYSVTVTKDEDLIIGDDEDILKASQKSPVTDTVTPLVPSIQKGSDGVKKSAEKDTELKLDGGEEDVLDAVKSPETAVPDSTASGKNSIAAPLADPAKADTAGVAGVKIESARSDSVKQVVAPVLSVADQPSKIEKTNSINFAQNLKEYRSPKVAMLLSLLIPGAGQVYAQHHSWKAAIYGAVEAAMIATSVAIRFKGKEKEDAAHKFADAHYNYGRYKMYQDFVLKQMVSDSVYRNIFLGGMDTVFGDEAAQKNSDFYSSIKGSDQPFVHGWDDAGPNYSNYTSTIMDDTNFLQHKVKDSIYLVYKKTDTTNFSYGFSENQKVYDSRISESNSFYRNSGLVLQLMIINHIVSAIDAGFTAKAHNDKLLNKESVWQHINIEQMYVSTGSGVIPGFALKVRF